MTSAEKIHLAYANDHLQKYMWSGCLMWAIREPAVLDQFRQDTGVDLKKGRSRLEEMIDEAAGVDEEIKIKFVDWFNENIWGLDLYEKDKE